MNTRRAFLRNAVAVGGAAAALGSLTGCASPSAPVLAADPKGMLDLPPGFTYAVLSRTGDEMSDGLLVPGAHDGMAAFPVSGDASRVILVRNHENSPSETGEGGAFGEKFARLAKFDASLAYDRTASGPAASRRHDDTADRPQDASRRALASQRRRHDPKLLRRADPLGVLAHLRGNDGEGGRGADRRIMASCSSRRRRRSRPSPPGRSPAWAGSIMRRPRSIPRPGSSISPKTTRTACSIASCRTPRASLRGAGACRR